MSIESTKKIIATIIVVIMMLGVTTPTFAATKKDSSWGDLLGGLASAATTVATGALQFAKETAAPALSNLTSSLKNVDTSAVKDIAKNAGTTILESLNGLKQTTLPATGGNEKTESIFGNILENVSKGVDKVKDILTTEKEDKDVLGELTTLGQGVETIGNKVKETLNGLGEKIENNKSSGISNIFKNIFNREYIEETNTEIKDKLNISEGNNIFASITDKFKNMFNFNKDEIAENGEVGKVETALNKVKEETQTLTQSIEQNGLLGGLSAYFKNKQNGAEVKGATADLENEDSYGIRDTIDKVKEKATTLFTNIKEENSIFGGIKKYLNNKNEITDEVEKEVEVEVEEKEVKGTVVSNSELLSGQGRRTKNWGYASELTIKNSHEYAIVNGTKYNDNFDYTGRTSVDESTNIVMVDNEYYCTAMGSAFGQVGDKFEVTIQDGDETKKIKVIMCDTKATEDSDYFSSDGKTVAHQLSGKKDILEFYCAKGGAYRTEDNSTWEYQEQFEGEITEIKKIEE